LAILSSIIDINKNNILARSL